MERLEEEAEALARVAPSVPICIVPNGVNLPEPTSRNELGPAWRTLLFLGRIHPKKGCDILVEAFARIAADHPDIVAKMRKEYEAWFKDVSSTRGYGPVRFFVGAPQENAVIEHRSRSTNSAETATEITFSSGWPS